MTKIGKKITGGLGITADVIGIVGFIYQIVQTTMNTTAMFVFLALIGIGSALTVWSILALQREKDQEALLAELTALKKIILRNKGKLTDEEKLENLYCIVDKKLETFSANVDGKIAAFEEKQEAMITREDYGQSTVNITGNRYFSRTLSLMERMLKVEDILSKKGDLK